MKRLLLFFMVVFLSCDKEDAPEVDLRNSPGEIILHVSLDENRWGSDDLHIILTLQNNPAENKELKEYLQNVGGKELPTELSVDWGDGTVNSKMEHTYAEYGNYSILIKGRGLNWFSDEKMDWRALSFIDVKKCTTLQGLSIKTSLSTSPADGNYDFSDNPYLEYFNFNGAPLTKSINLSKNKLLKGVVIYYFNYDIDFSTLTSLRFATIMRPYEKTFPQILKNKNINYLKVSGLSVDCDFSELSQLSELVLVDCSATGIVVGKKSKLRRLIIHHNHAILHEQECPYNDEIVNTIYSTLPSVSGTLTTNLPFGDKTIAEKKGWTVEEIDE